MAEIPAGAAGAAIAVLIYSFVCLGASCLVIWLTWQHFERWSCPYTVGEDVACIAYATTIGTLCSIIQQIHAIHAWRRILTARFLHLQDHSDDPEAVMSNGSLGLDLVLFYIQFYCYNVEGLLVTFCVRNLAGKVLAALVPIVSIASLQASPIRSNSEVFLLLAGIPLMFSIGLGGLSVLAILIRYIVFRIRVQKFQVTYGWPNSDISSSTLPAEPIGKRNMYDQWLLARFTAAFVVLSVFEITILVFKIHSADNINKDIQGDQPDLSSQRAIQDFLLFLPGVSASLLVFLVFGTTRPFLEYMRSCLFAERDQSSLEALPLQNMPSASLSTLASVPSHPGNHAPARPETEIWLDENEFYSRNPGRQR
ncbi:hypothetical protein B0I35DRAFT_414729 [Stachybotrys elegans]|uniref:Uncharacterized protein n=1 Tax=Stachybotrys elegans TaxID=80388 RepID=A0A8K0SE82_9HYPO|nr:hypothetical protein B0I35DRAFT_414729 [Stachybotrys elegans]